MSDEENDKFYDYLQERVNRLRIDCLFEEPCPLYEDDEYYELD